MSERGNTGEYAITQGIRLLRALGSEGLNIFSVDNARSIAPACGVAIASVSFILHRLAASGWIQRLRKGLYAGTGSLPGEQHIHPFAVSTRLFEPSAVCHWSALQHHGLTEQLPQVVNVMTTRKVVTPSMRNTSHARHVTGKHQWEVAGTRIEFITVHPDHFFGIEQVWVDQLFRIPITDPERTTLDLCISPRYFGGMHEVLGIVAEHWQRIDLSRLIDYAIRYRKIVIARRLGWALEMVGATSSHLEKILALPSSSYGLVDPTRPHTGPYDRRWKLRNNL